MDTNKALKENNNVTYSDSINLAIEVRPCVLGEITVGDTCEVCLPD